MNAIRLQRFKAFEDTGWIEFKPITLLFGYNSAGKSTILQALLMLKQSIQNPASEVPFVFSSTKGVDLGAFEDVVHKHFINYDKPMIIELRTAIPQIYIESLYTKNETKALAHKLFGGKKKQEKLSEIEYSMEIAYNEKRHFIDMLSFHIKEREGRTILQMKKSSMEEDAKITFQSDFLDLSNKKLTLTWYNFLPLVKSEAGFLALSNITESLKENIKTQLENMENIGPIRAKPERTMLFSGEKLSSVGISGEDTFKLLFSDKYSATPKNLEEFVNKWLKNYGYKFEWNMLKSNLGQFVLTEKTTDGKEVTANIADVGFGISQVLPIAVQLYVTEEDGVLLVEQPEIHLHSKAQAELADLFIDAVKTERKYVIIETHSENLLLRLRRRIAESALQQSDDNYLSPDDVSIYYIGHQNGKSEVAPMNINEFGDLTNMPEEFKKFFLDDFNDIMELHNVKGKMLSARNNEE